MNRKLAFWILAALVAGRILAPYVAEVAIDRILDVGDGIHGDVDDVDLALWRGAVRLENIILESEDDEVDTPLFHAASVEIQIAWSSLFRGEGTLAVVVEEPDVRAVATRAKPGIEDIKSIADPAWIDRMLRLIPVDVAHFTVRDGKVRYLNEFADPPVDLVVDEIGGSGRDLAKAGDSTDDRPADLRVEARVFGSGETSLEIVFDPASPSPDFDLDFEMINAPIPAFNDLLRARGGLDVETGTLSIYSEVIASGGSFKGYVKPLIRELEVAGDGENDDAPIRKIWENLVGAAAELLENQPADQTGARVEIGGSFENPEVSVPSAVSSVLGNAILEALEPRIEGLDELSSND